ncbi:T6SS immunity protein Tli4 family protein [Massilia aurea]|uniref:T6SS immunity protein Tli4 family protein n=1 Tax=Massilia aurea TaxID=373040 RepID=UPI0011CDD730|nr:T6SS immunity protein Tli4 family protein [Massilia aurea]
MKWILLRKFIVATIVSIIAVVILAFYSKLVIVGEPMEARSQRVEKMFEKTKIVCFGRFVMEIPDRVALVYGDVTANGDIKFYRDESEKITEMLAVRLSDIEKERKLIPDYSLINFPLVGKVIDGVVPGQKTVFGIANSISYKIHSYIPIGKDLFIYDSKMFPESNEIPFINTVANNLRSRAEAEVPAEPGICVESGFLSVEPTFEKISIGLRFHDFPDVHISIDARKNQDYLMEGGGLKESREGARARAEAHGFGGFFSRIKVLRESQRQLGTWEGEEILTRRPAYKDDTEAHEFRFFSLGEVNNALCPMLDIQLDSGVKGNAKAKVKPSITDAEALDLWDRILPTIRLRQPGDATTLKQDSKVQLGSVTKSGDICPQSGWWECLEKRKIEGERRRLFKAGDMLPPVLADGGASLWNTLIGNTHQIAAVEWKLLEYDPPSAFLVDKKGAGIPQADNDMKENDA